MKSFGLNTYHCIDYDHYGKRIPTKGEEAKWKNVSKIRSENPKTRSYWPIMLCVAASQSNRESYDTTGTVSVQLFFGFHGNLYYDTPRTS